MCCALAYVLLGVMAWAIMELNNAIAHYNSVKESYGNVTYERFVAANRYSTSDTLKIFLTAVLLWPFIVIYATASWCWKKLALSNRLFRYVDTRDKRKNPQDHI